MTSHELKEQYRELLDRYDKMNAYQRRYGDGREVFDELRRLRDLMQKIEEGTNIYKLTRK